MQAFSAKPRAAAFRAAPSAQPRRAVVVAAKPTKLADFAALSNEEALDKLAALKKEYVMLQYYQRTRGYESVADMQGKQELGEKVPKGNEFKHTRRQIAQLWTREFLATCCDCGPQTARSMLAACPLARVCTLHLFGRAAGALGGPGRAAAPASASMLPPPAASGGPAAAAPPPGPQWPAWPLCHHQGAAWTACRSSGGPRGQGSLRAALT
jgi:ribosomal protein L29